MRVSTRSPVNNVKNSAERFDPGSLAGLRGRNIALPAYAGPLDLLLKLIRKNEVDIYDIPVASITEQYLAEMEAMEQSDLLVGGDFLLMAATLLEIKSAMLLPSPPLPPGEDEGIDPRAELVQRLLEYQAFQAAAGEMARLEARRRMLFVRPFAPAALTDYVPLRPTAPNLKAGALQRSLQAVLERMIASSSSVTSVARQQMPLRLRTAEVLGELGAAGPSGLLLEELSPPDYGRLFLIVTFLAILELLRAGRIDGRPADGNSTYRFWLSSPGRLRRGTDAPAPDEQQPDEQQPDEQQPDEQQPGAPPATDDQGPVGSSGPGHESHGSG